MYTERIDSKRYIHPVVDYYWHTIRVTQLLRFESDTEKIPGIGLLFSDLNHSDAAFECLGAFRTHIVAKFEGNTLPPTNVQNTPDREAAPFRSQDIDYS